MTVIYNYYPAVHVTAQPMQVLVLTVTQAHRCVIDFQSNLHEYISFPHPRHCTRTTPSVYTSSQLMRQIAHIVQPQPSRRGNETR